MDLPAVAGGSLTANLTAKAKLKLVRGFRLAQALVKKFQKVQSSLAFQLALGFVFRVKSTYTVLEHLEAVGASAYVSMYCSVRMWFTRRPPLYSIHIWPPPAPQQNP